MKKITKKRAAELDKMISEDGDEQDWDERKLGNDPKHAKVAHEFAKTKTSIGTSIRMPLSLIKSLKRIADEEGVPYQTLVKMVLTKYVKKKEKVA